MWWNSEYIVRTHFNALTWIELNLATPSQDLEQEGEYTEL